jgi:hypothetical protein
MEYLNVVKQTGFRAAVTAVLASLFENDFVIPFIPLRTKMRKTTKLHPYIYGCNNLKCIVTPFTPLRLEKEGWLETQWVAVFRFNTVNADVVYYQTQPIFPSCTSQVRSPS